MKIRYTRGRGPVVLCTALGLTAAGLAVVPAVATAHTGTKDVSQTSADSPMAAQAALVKGLSTKLGGATAGSYVDDAGKLVVTVTNADAAKAVRAAGAQPRTVDRSQGDLKKVMAALKRDATVPGTAWAADPKTDQVVLSVDKTVTGAKLAKVKKAAAKHGAAVRLAHIGGRLRPLTAGGEAIWTSGGRCSLGFNVKKGSDYYFLTAGHCTAIGKSWSEDQGGSKPLGDTVDGTFPGHDYGLVKYASAPSDTKGVVSLYGKGEQDITGAGEAVVGQTVTRSGSTTQVHDGKVTALDQTVNYQEGSVSGLIQTTVCAEPGDSGGSLFAGDKALGLTSGGSGDCTSGGETFFQPIGPALQAFGVELY